MRRCGICRPAGGRPGRSSPATRHSAPEEAAAERPPPASAMARAVRAWDLRRGRPKGPKAGHHPPPGPVRSTIRPDGWTKPRRQARPSPGARPRAWYAGWDAGVTGAGCSPLRQMRRQPEGVREHPPWDRLGGTGGTGRSGHSGPATQGSGAIEAVSPSTVTSSDSPPTVTVTEKPFGLSSRSRTSYGMSCSADGSRSVR